ncbi:S9 family peptidase [Aestuariibaculum marinum]|uniref:S9 family peptidase n=1 Tax=Aestuariibaculum marinum TaxID=2683592 RepID=A0A8J6PVE6_9FLAO|nr:prolyl oligopeptidase family serine peptidase [Aestuariibaculum marinum]MBD0824450.1 S9 family peptidase [Aestuariibaculum marinum]
MKSNSRIIILICFLLLNSLTQAQQPFGNIMEGFPSAIEELFDKGHPQAKVLGPGLFSNSPPLIEQYSLTTNQFAGTQNGSFYIRAADTDSFTWSITPKDGWYWNIDNSLWSPNGQYIIVKQTDDRKVPEIKLSQDNFEKITYKKYSRAGQNIPIEQFYIINPATGAKTAIEQQPNLTYVHVLEWSNASDKLFLIAADRLMKEVHLQMVDANTGKATDMLVEKSDTYLIGLNLLQGYSKRLQDMQVASFWEDKNQFTWMSERSGYNQIYLYDYTGKLIRPLTNFSENGIVSSIQKIDKESRTIYFLAHSDKEHPYSSQLYKTNLKKEEITKVVDTPGIMELFFPYSKDTLWILRSALPKTLQLDRYSPQGKYYDSPWKGNFSSIKENYFNYEYVTTSSADETIKLRPLILKPSNLDESKTYPVVEYIYGGNSYNVVPLNVLDKWLWEMNRLAQEGYIVVFIDGRGTAERGKAFQDFSYGKFGQVELEDHISVLKQLGKDRPYMDMDRIGVIGHSWGGHFALRAVLEAPDFYKAAHLNAPAIEPKEFRVAIEPFMGCLPKNCPERYAMSGILNKLDRLKAPLMIVHGTADDDVPIDESYKLMKFLDQRNYKNYTFVPYDGMGHIVMRNPEWLPNVVRFFEENLK